MSKEGLIVVYFIFFILLASLVSAIPPYSGLEDKIKSGAVENIYNMQFYKNAVQNGLDQPSDFKMSSFLNTKKAEMNKKGIATPVPFNILVVLVDFKDKPAQSPQTLFDRLIFNDTGISVRTYYQENSYGNLDIVTLNTPSGIEWIRMPQTYAYYVNSNYGLGEYPRNTQKLFEDLINIIDPYVDFSKYDNNGDGYVDGIVIVHAGRGAEFSGDLNDIWSHKWGINPVLKDRVYIQDYSIQPEYWNSPGDITIGVYAHEIGHLFGLPDLYDNDGSSKGVGRWSVMADGVWNGNLGSSPADLDAWSKIKLGFVNPSIISSSPTTVTLPNIEQNPSIYKLWKDNVFGNEYFLIENRQKIGYDSYIPGSGLLIWHIDESKTGDNKEWYPGYTSFGNYEVALDQADGLWNLEKNMNVGDANDPYPGGQNKRSFTVDTIPNSESYSQENSYVRVEQISNSGSTMSARLVVHSTADFTPPTVSITSPIVSQTFTGNFTLSASASDDVGISKVQFYFDGKNIGESTSSPYSITWNSKSTSLGTHILYAEAIDTSGNTANSTILNLNTIYCGDLDKNGIYNVFDIVNLINYAFRGGAAPVPLAIGDTNGDGVASDVLDVNTLVDYTFRNGPPPASCNTVTSQIVPPSQGIGSVTAKKPTTTAKQTSTKGSLTAKVIDEISNFKNGIGLIIIVILIILIVLIIKSVNKDKKKRGKLKR